MIVTAIRFIKVASKVATVAWAAKNGYELYQKGKKIKKAYDTVTGVKKKARKFIK